MAIKGLALIEERDRRKKKKEKELVQLKSPEKKETTSVKKTINNKGTTYVDRNTISKKPTIQNTTQNRVVTNKDRLSSNSTFGGINTDIRTVKTQNKPKYSTETADIYERGGRYYYKDDKKEKEIDRSFVEDAIKNKRTGVIGRYDSKGTLRATDEKGNVKEQNLLNKAGYLGRTAKTRAKKGAYSIVDAALQEAQNDLQKGENLKTTGDRIAKFASAILNSNPQQGMRTAISKAMANSREIWKDKDKNALQKYVGTLLEGSQAISTGSTQGLKDIRELAGSLDKNLDEKVAKAQQKLDAPVNKELEQLEEEKYKYGKGVRQAAETVGLTANMAVPIAISMATRNPQLGTLAASVGAKGQATERALQSGADLDTSVKYGTAIGDIEYLLEGLSSGLKVFGKGPKGNFTKKAAASLDEVIERAINAKIKSKPINFGAKSVVGILGEDVEEILSDIFGTAVDKGSIDPNATYTLKDAKDTIFNTSLSTLLTNAMTGGYGRGAYNQNINDMQNFQTKQSQQAEVIEQVNNGTIDKSEANQKFEQIENGTYEQNKNLDQIATQQRDAIVQAVQTGQLSQVEATQEMEALSNTLASERERINTPQNQAQTQAQENETTQPNAITQETQNVSQNKKNDYRGSHQIEGAKPITEVNLEEVENKIKETAGSLTKQDQNDLRKLKRILSSPDETIKIYRASPKNELNNGDWVTTDKSYAKNVADNNGGKVYEYEVKANQLHYPDDIKQLPSLHRLSSFRFTNNVQNEQRSTQESTFNNKIEETKKAEETFRNIKTKEDMDNLISNLKDKVDNIKTGEDLKNTFKEIYDIYKVYNKSNAIYEVVEKDGLYGTRFESEIYNPDIKYKPLNEEIKIQKNNLENWLRIIKDDSEKIIYNNQDKVTPTIGKNIDSLDKVTPITTDDFKNKLHDYIDKETEDIKGKFESKDGHLFRGGKEVRYLYRAIDQAEMDSIKNSGYIKSNQSKNIGYEIEQGLTDFKDGYPGFYLPRNADGYIIKIEVKPENGFFYDFDEYAKTPNEIPANQIVEINGEKIKAQQETTSNQQESTQKKKFNNELADFINSETDSNKAEMSDFFEHWTTDYDKNQGRSADGTTTVFRFKKGNNEAKLTITENENEIWIDELYIKNQKQGYGKEIVDAIKKYAYEKEKEIRTFKEVGSARKFWDKMFGEETDTGGFSHRYIKHKPEYWQKRIEDTQEQIERFSKWKENALEQGKEDLANNHQEGIDWAKKRLEEYKTEYEKLKQEKSKNEEKAKTNDKIDKRLEKYKNNNLTKEQQNQILKIKDQLEKDINLIKDTSENMYSSEEKGRKIKGYSLQAAGEIREIIQGDSLDLIDNGLTPTELQKKLDRENSNYNGKEVIVDGKKGKILSRAYGKYKIELEDGNVVTKTKEEFESAKKIPRFVSEVNDYRTVKQEGETTEENEKRYYQTNRLQNENIPATKSENVITIKNDNLKNTPKDQIKSENTGVSIGDKQVKVEVPVDSKPNKLGQYVPKDGFTKKELKSGKLGDSKFYKNVTERADFIRDEVREKIKNDDYIEHYRKVTNEESMQEAFNDLNTRGTEAIADFFNNDKELTSKDTAMGWLLIAQSQENGDYDFSNQVLRKMRSNATKTGQTMQMYNYYARLTPEGMYKWCGDQLLRAEEIFEQGKTKKWIEANKKRWQLNGEEVEFIKSQMQRVQELNQMNDNDTTTIDVKGKTKEVTVDRAKQVEIAKIQAMIENKIPPEKGKAINAWMRISMLGNLKTIGTRNPLGNIALRPVNDVGDFAASLVDYAISKKTGVRTKGNVNLTAQAKGLKKGTSETVQDFRLGINTRNAKGNRFEIGEGKAFNEQHTGIAKVLNPISKLENKSDRGISFLLDLGDRPFYEANYQQSLENQMRLNGIEKIEDVPDWMKNIAETEGLERTYQDDNDYTKSVIAIRNAMNRFNVKGYGLGDVIIPFAKTPANLTKAIVDYSPAGFVNAITKGNQLRISIDNGQFTPEMQHAFVNQLGKATAGTILYAVGAALANSGLITGGSDEDKDVADFMKNTLGIQPYSIKVGNKSFTYDWAQPLASGLAIPADIKKTLEDAKEGEVDLEYIIHKSFSTAGSVLLEQSFLQGIKDVLGGYGDPIDNLLSEIEGLPARAIPTLFQQIVTYLDGTKRMSYGNKGIQNMKAQAQAKTPWAKDLPVYRNSLGKEVKMYGGKNNFFNVFINPANYSEGQVTESAEEIYKIYKATNKKDILPRLVSNDLKNEDGTKLTNKQKSDFLKISGDIIDDNVKELKNNYDYRNMNDEDKAEAIKGIVEYAYNKARNEITGHELSSEYQKTDNAVESGYALADYYATQKYLKSITPKKEKTTPTRNRYEELMEKGIDGITFDKFKNYATNTRGESRTGGLSKNQKIKNYIQKLPLTAKQKAALWKDYKENQRFFTYYN